MKNTLAKTISCALFLSAATVANAQTYTWNYTLDASDKATITGVSPEPEGSITIPTTLDGHSVIGLGDSAFANCTNLTSVTIPASVERFGEYAFDGCVGLKSVHIFNLAHWCETIFGSADDDYDYYRRGDYGLRTANPLGYAHDLFIDGELFAGDVSLPDGIARIGNFAFYGCTNLTSVTVPNSVTDIGRSVFLGCTSLTNMVLPFVGSHRGREGEVRFGLLFFTQNWPWGEAGVEIPQALRNITITDDTAFGYGNRWGGGAFQNLGSVADITLPETLTDLGSWTFSGCSSLTNVNIPAGIKVIHRATFNGCSRLAEINLPDGVTSIDGATSWDDYGAFQGCSSLAEFTIPQSVTNIGMNAFNGCTSLTHIEIPSSVTKIESGTFRYCRELNDFAVSENITSIGDRAFEGCSGLTNVNIGAGLKSCSIASFLDCTALKSVNITNLAAWCTISFHDGYANPLYYAQNLFLNGELVTNVVLDENIMSIGSHVFDGYAKLESIVLPDTIKSISEYAFRSCTTLQNVAIPDSVETIGMAAFNSCQNLTSVEFPGSVVNLSSYAFSDCVSLTNVVLQQGVETIGQSAFSGCRALEAISIPSSLTASYRGAFSYCQNIKAVYITDLDAWNKIRFETENANPTYYGADLYLNDAPVLVLDRYEDIKENAYVGQNITHVYLHDGVTTIGANAFANCPNLVFVSMCETLTNISDSAFSGCRSLSRIDWPASVASVGWDAFSGCSSLDGVNITNLAAWCGTTFTNDAANPLYLAHNLYFDDVLLEDLTVPEGVESISAYAFTSCHSITNVSLSSETWSVGNYAFANCANLAHIDLAEAESIGNWAFMSCPELAEVHIPASVTNFGGYAFSDCAKFAKIDIESLDAWYDIDFKYAECNPLYYAHNLYVNGTSVTDLVVPESVEAIKQYAFCNATNIATVAIPATFASSGSGSFYGCTGLESVSITNLAAWCGVSFANREANPLYYAKNLLLDGTTLRGVTLPADVASVGDHAFVNCTNIVRLSALGTDTRIPSSAFDGCTGVSSVLTPRTLEGQIAAIFPNAEEAYRATNMEEPAVIAENGIKILSKRLIDEEQGIWELTLDVTLESGVSDTFDDDAIKVVSAPTAKKLRAIDVATATGDEHVSGSVEVEEKAAVSFNVVPETEGAPRQFYRLVVETAP